MAIAVRLPAFLPDLTSALVRVVHISEGEAVEAGHALVDLFVDLSGGYAYDCPPRAFYRLTLGEGGRITRVDVKAGETLAVRESFAGLEPDRRAGDGEREAVVVVASIVFHDDWWDESD